VKHVWNCWQYDRKNHLHSSALRGLTACSLVGFSQPKPASQQCFPLTKNQHQPAQTSTSTNQRTGPTTLAPRAQVKTTVYAIIVIIKSWLGPIIFFNKIN